MAGFFLPFHQVLLRKEMFLHTDIQSTLPALRTPPQPPQPATALRYR